MRRTLIAAMLTALALAACGGADGTEPEPTAPTDTADVDPDPGEADEGGSGQPQDAFPVTVTDGRGVVVTIDEPPERIVSLSATHTEILFGIDAGSQVVAVDEQSTFPPEAPTTTLSGFEPNLEAIAEEEPDLVVVAYDPGELIDALERLDVDVLYFDTATSLDDAYDQWRTLGAATGRLDAADELVVSTQERIAELVAAAPSGADGLTYYHEIDETLYAATSSTFIGEVYGLFGLQNVADEADVDGFGFPQLSEEYLFDADPDLVFLAAAVYGQTAEVVAARPGWDTLTAVREGDLVEVDPDLASRWGPRVVAFVELIGEAVASALDR